MTPHQCQLDLLAILCVVLAFIVAVEELPIEQLNSNNSKDELEKGVDNEDVEDILEGNNDAVKYSLKLGNSTNNI